MTYRPVKLVFAPPERWKDYPEDISRMQTIVKKLGATASDRDLGLAWQDYGDSMAAGWMSMDDLPDNIVANILQSRMRVQIT